MNKPISEPTFAGGRIRALRKQRSLPAEAVARRADISLRHLHRLEAGQRPNTSAVTLTRVALALDTTVEYLLGVTEDSRAIHEFALPAVEAAGGDGR
ncbi:MAG TPA: XRE family transcriptional regulator [Chloroflexi bacterium]|nr:XRE family transcriptional regulator [Chloroflexota bacterium]